MKNQTSKKCIRILILLTFFLTITKFLLINFYQLKSNIYKIKNLEKYENGALTRKNNSKEIFRFYDQISKSEKKYFSQNGEDGVIIFIFEKLKIKNLNKYFIEIGTESGLVLISKCFFK